jgi:membrane protease YdiL (CAAX protease family)
MSRYFNNVEKYKNSRLILELTLICFILKFVFVILAAIIFSYLNISTNVDNSFEIELAKSGLLSATIQTIIFASFETLTGQWLVIWLVSKFTNNNFWKILASAIVFAALHVEPLLIAAVFPIGLILAWVFIIKLKKSKTEAFWVTTAVHVLHNLVVLGLVSYSL